MSRRIVSSGTSPRRRTARSSSVGSRRETRPTARSNSRTKIRNVDSQSRRRRRSTSSGMLGEGDLRVAQRPLQHDDDRVALADLALGHHPPEPAPVVADGDVGGPCRPAATHAAGLRDPLHQAPCLGLGEGQAGGAMAQAQGLPDLALGERLAARHQVGMHARDRGRDAPRSAHLAPGIGQRDADLLGDGRGGAPRRLDRGSGVGHAAIASARRRNLSLPDSRFSGACARGLPPPMGLPVAGSQPGGAVPRLPVTVPVPACAESTPAWSSSPRRTGTPSRGRASTCGLADDCRRRRLRISAGRPGAREAPPLLRLRRRPQPPMANRIVWTVRNGSCAGSIGVVHDATTTGSGATWNV